MNKYKMVIVGATGSAYKRTLPALRNSRICEVVALQGRNTEKLKQIAQEFSVPKIYVDAKEMLDKEKFDIVFIGTPPFMHFDDISLASKYGKIIISEKPLASSLTDAEKIAKVLTSSGVKFMLAHHLRHQKSVSDIKRALEEHIIGDVLSVWGQWSFMLNKDAANAKWKLEPKLGGYGPFGDAGIHVIDMMIYLFGVPNYVVSHGFQLDFPLSNDNMTAIFGYGNKTIVLSASQTMAKPGNHLLIYGQKGSIEVFNAFGEKSIRQVKFATKDEEKIVDYPAVNLYGTEVENFLLSLDSGVPNIGTTLEEAILGNRLIEAINQSSTGHKYIKFS